MAGTNEEVKLIGSWVSPYVMRASIAFNLKGVSYEFLQEELFNKSQLLLKSNPVYKMMPVLLHNNKAICESLIIVEYIDEAWSSCGPPLLPADPYDRSIARFWAQFVDDKVSAAIRAMLLAETEEAEDEALGQLRDGLQHLEEAFWRCSKGRGFFNGDTIGYLDIAFGSILGWLRATERASECNIFEEAKTPLLVGWAERFCANAAVKELMPEIERLVEYRKRIQAKLGIVRLTK